MNGLCRDCVGSKCGSHAHWDWWVKKAHLSSFYDIWRIRGRLRFLCWFKPWLQIKIWSYSRLHGRLANENQPSKSLMWNFHDVVWRINHQKVCLRREKGRKCHFIWATACLLFISIHSMWLWKILWHHICITCYRFKIGKIGSNPHRFIMVKRWIFVTIVKKQKKNLNNLIAKHDLNI